MLWVAPRKPVSTGSLINKLDRMRQCISCNQLDSHVALGETWLHENISNLAVELAVFSLCCTDHTPGVYIYNSWCTNTTVIDRHYCLNLEFSMLRCRPFHLPRDFTAVFIIAVYVHPRANAVEKLHDAIQRHQNKHTELFYSSR